MKIVFCGPPHSGKSVFIANLISKMPTDSHTIIRACPDGEGNWSNNKGQNETNMVRKKGKFTDTFIDDSCKAIDNQTNKVVLVDVGGIMSKENEKIFKHCDSFIVLSSDEKKKKEWLEFGENLGLECIACLDSSLEGQEEIYVEEPYLKGKIVGLERGRSLENSEIIMKLMSTIIKKSQYVQKKFPIESKENTLLIDDTELGFELGYGKEIMIDNHVIKQVKWKENAVPKLYHAIQEKVAKNQTVKINGIRANYAIMAICKACKQEEITDIRTFDIRSKQYIPIKNIPQKRGQKECSGLKYHLIQNKKNIFMDIDITNEKYTLEDYQKCILPKINTDKSLYLSGRIPLWLLASIGNSYDSRNMYTFQPGRGFTCVCSENEKDLGIRTNQIDGIDINKYFQEKQKIIQEQKYPTVVKKQSLFERIKSLFIKNKETEIASSVKEIENTLDAIKVSPDKLNKSEVNNNKLKSQSKETKYLDEK